MAYELHLTRADAWWDPAEQPITVVDLVGACLQVGLTLGGDGKRYFQLGRVEQRGAVRPLMSATLDGGQLTLKPAPPDADAAGRVTALAAALRARVQGDDGEVYEAAPVVDRGSATVSRRRFWQRR